MKTMAGASCEVVVTVTQNMWRRVSKKNREVCDYPQGESLNCYDTTNCKIIQWLTPALEHCALVLLDSFWFLLAERLLLRTEGEQRHEIHFVSHRIALSRCVSGDD